MFKENKSLLVLIIIWIGVVIFGGVYYKLESQSKVINKIEVSKSEKKIDDENNVEVVKFYIPNSEFTQLIEKNETIPISYKKRDRIEIVAKKSFKNLYESNILDTPQVEINGIFIRGDEVFIDCGEEINPLEEENKKNLLGIYSLVNSITEIPGIKRVKILVNGKENEQNFSRTYSRNMKF